MFFGRNKSPSAPYKASIILWALIVSAYLGEAVAHKIHGIWSFTGPPSKLHTGPSRLASFIGLPGVLAYGSFRANQLATYIRRVPIMEHGIALDEPVGCMNAGEIVDVWSGFRLDDDVTPTVEDLTAQLAELESIIETGRMPDTGRVLHKDELVAAREIINTLQNDLVATQLAQEISTEVGGPFADMLNNHRSPVILSSAKVETDNRLQVTSRIALSLG